MNIACLPRDASRSAIARYVTIWFPLEGDIDDQFMGVLYPELYLGTIYRTNKKTINKFFMKYMSSLF